MEASRLPTERLPGCSIKSALGFGNASSIRLSVSLMELVRDSLERTNREQQRPFYPVMLTVIVSSDEWKPGTKPAVL
jgi:hypothetical protein